MVTPSGGRIASAQTRPVDRTPSPAIKVRELLGRKCRRRCVTTVTFVTLRGHMVRRDYCLAWRVRNGYGAELMRDGLFRASPSLPSGARSSAFSHPVPDGLLLRSGHGLAPALFRDWRVGFRGLPSGGTAVRSWPAGPTSRRESNRCPDLGTGSRFLQSRL